MDLSSTILIRPHVYITVSFNVQALWEGGPTSQLLDDKQEYVESTGYHNLAWSCP